MPALFGDSSDANVSGVTGENSADRGTGVQGNTVNGTGVAGLQGVVDHPFETYGVFGASEGGDGVKGRALNSGGTGVYGENAFGVALRGETGSTPGSIGVLGTTDENTGYSTQAPHGVVGASGTGNGVRGESEGAPGVQGVSRSEFAGVQGTNDADGPGVVGRAASSDSYGVAGQNTGIGVLGASGNPLGNPQFQRGPHGVLGASQTGDGVRGLSWDQQHSGVHAQNYAGGFGVYAETNSNVRASVRGQNAGSGPGVTGDSKNGVGVLGNSQDPNSASVQGIKIVDGPAVEGRGDSGPGVQGSSAGAIGVVGSSSNPNVASVAGVKVGGVGGPGVWGEADSGSGVQGSSTDGNGVHGESYNSNASGVYGKNNAGGPGIRAVGGNSLNIPFFTNLGLFAESADGLGVLGACNNTFGSGVQGYNLSAAGNTGGIFGSVNSPNGTAVYGENFAGGQAGRFLGNVDISGTLTAGTKPFKIDHPLDPANKYLYHSSIESPDMTNIYNGNVTTDEKGQATVQLPEYFEALNRDFRYQLTAIGQFAQAIVEREIEDNSFSIKTDKPNVKVSWQVTGIRQDAYAEARRVPVEQDKPESERGRYLHPELYGEDTTQQIGTLSAMLGAEPGDERSGSM